MPSPLAVASELPVLDRLASRLLPRHAASISAAYFSGAMPVARVIASACDQRRGGAELPGMNV